MPVLGLAWLGFAWLVYVFVHPIAPSYATYQSMHAILALAHSYIHSFIHVCITPPHLTVSFIRTHAHGHACRWLWSQYELGVVFTDRLDGSIQKTVVIASSLTMPSYVTLSYSLSSLSYLSALPASLALCSRHSVPPSLRCNHQSTDHSHLHAHPYYTFTKTHTYKSIIRKSRHLRNRVVIIRACVHARAQILP